MKVKTFGSIQSTKSKHKSESDFEREEGPGEKCWGIMAEENECSPTLLVFPDEQKQRMIWRKNLRDLKSHHDDVQGAWKPNSVPAGSSGAHLHPLLAAAQPPQRPN